MLVAESFPPAQSLLTERFLPMPKPDPLGTT